MGNKFSFTKNKKLDVQHTIEEVNKEQFNSEDEQDIDFDDDEFEQMITARYENIERERERSQNNAFNEIHVSFFRINLNKYLDFIDNYIDKPNSYYESLNLKKNIEERFFTYMNNNFDESLKKSSVYKLIKILSKLFESDCYKLEINKWNILIGKTLEYVFKQDNKFISTYIITFINDNYGAYKEQLSNVSCSQGIIERFVTTISVVLEILCITNADCTDEQSIELYKILNNTIDINELTQKWAVEHLDTEKIQSMNMEDRKNHFISFITHQYALKKKQDISKQEMNNIIKYANELETAGIFERGYFGGKKGQKLKKNKKYKTKKNKQKNIKKTKRKN